MPKMVHATPKYRRHKPSGQAVVTIAGRDHYLGPWRTKASRCEYDRLIGEWLAAGRPTVAAQSRSDLTITELAAAYWRFAQTYYVKNGKPTATGAIKAALGYLKRYYGHTCAADFGPLALAALQARMVELPKRKTRKAPGSAGDVRDKTAEPTLSRRYINDTADHVRRVFKWAAAQELIPVAVYQALATVPGLRKGKTDAREPEPIGPVADETVEATLPHLQSVVADMIRLQRLTGARPAEICILRPCDVDRSGKVWSYRPKSHKTEHHGRERVIFFGPKAQAILLPYLLRAADGNCFSPRESEDAHNAARREARESPMTPSQASRRRVRKPARAAGDCYTTASYRRAIHRAADKANSKAHDDRPEVSADVRLVPRWSPNRLRHSAATEIRKQYGLEAVQVVLGHSQADVTQIYAERDLAKAAAIMAEVG